MSKTIKVDDHVYTRLTTLQRPRETYSQTVDRLINVSDNVTRFIVEIGASKFSTMPRPEGKDEAKL